MYKSFTILAITAAYASANDPWPFLSSIDTCTWDWPVPDVNTQDNSTTSVVTPTSVPFDITEHLC